MAEEKSGRYGTWETYERVRNKFWRIRINYGLARVMGKKIQLEEKDIRKLRASINRLVKLVDCLPNTKESTYARGTIQTLQLDIDRYLKKYA